MKIIPLKLAGSYQIIPSPTGDRRGFFMRTYDLNRFNEFGLNRIWVQENHSRSSQKGIIRGLHFQFAPFAETKLVRCIRGAILDVFVDLRKHSRTFGQWDSVELSEANKKMVFIPRGFAHGFCTLSEVSEVLYKVDNLYSAEHEGGLLWNDKELDIPWPTDDPLLSDKDKRNMTFGDFLDRYQYIAI